MKIALANYPIERLPNWQAFVDKQSRLARAAKSEGAFIAVWPEYLGMELAGLFDDATAQSVEASAKAIQVFHDDFVALFSGLAQSLQMILVAGSFLVQDGPRFRNRTYCCMADGSIKFQDKLTLTQFEVNAGCIKPGDALHGFQLSDPSMPKVRFAIQICYDIEFPIHARRLIESGCELILVPSCTDTPAGAERVRLGCRARALENQCLVARAVTTGEARWSGVLDRNLGVAGLFGPIDVGSPSDGVLAESSLDANGVLPEWCVADLPVSALAAARLHGQVHNRNDWQKQDRPGILQVRINE